MNKLNRRSGGFILVMVLMAASLTRGQVEVKVYNKYDSYGNVLEATDAGDTHIATRYDQQGVVPVARFINATYNQTYIDNFTEADTYEAPSGWSDHQENPYAYASWEVEDGKLIQATYAPSASNWGSDYVVHTLEASMTGKVVFEFDVTLPHSDGWDLTISMGDNTYSGGNTGTGCAVWSGFQQSSWEYYGSDGAWHTIAANLRVGETYHLKIVANTSTHTADYYVDGKKMASGGTFRNPSVSSIRKVSIGYYGHNDLGAKWYIDNVRVYPDQAIAYSQGYDPVTYQMVDQTGENGNTDHYSYDGFNRLARTYDPQERWLTQSAYSYSAGRHGGSYDADDPNFVQTIRYTDPDGFSDFTVNDGWSVTGGSGITFGSVVDGRPAVKMVSSTGNYQYIRKRPVYGEVVARTNVCLTSGVNGTPHILSFDGSNYRFGVNYNRNTHLFYVETRMNGGAYTASYSFNVTVALNKWYTVEIIKRINGTCQAWAYPAGGNRDYRDTYRKSGYPIGWDPYLYSWTNSTSGYYYLANAYVGSFEQNTTWLDGLGRAIQSQSLGGDAGDQTITSGAVYDGLGREVVTFRPIQDSGVSGYQTDLSQPGWAPGDALTSASAVYSYYHNAAFPGYADDAPWAYSRKTYDSDPLNRVHQTGGGGADFRIGSGHETTYSYGVNTGSGDTFSGYGVNTLTKTTVEDPNHHKQITYKNGFGQTIARVVDMDGNGVKSSGDLVTQFNYDVLGNLVTTTDPKGLPTTYTYDPRGELTSKDMPDQDNPTDYKYDKAGRLRFVRDANHKANGGFIYHKYDALGRVTEVGEYTGSVSAFTNTTDINNDSWPTSSNEPYIKYYYGPDYGYSGGSLHARNLKGRLAGVEYGELHYYIPHASFTWYSYDKQGNVEWVVQDIYGFGEKVIEYTYSPQGRLTKLSFQPSTSDESCYFWYYYDPHGNLTSVWSNDTNDLTGATPEARYTYFPDGQVRQMDLGPNTQRVDYAYNVRGWLKRINDPGSLSGNTGYPDDRFAQSLYYTDSSYPQYNGNISRTAWKLAPSLRSASDSPEYTYHYDTDNRLTEADYSNSGSTEDNTDGYDVVGLSYDASGNIQGYARLNAGGANAFSHTYSYTPNTNRLSQVKINGVPYSLDYDQNGNTTGSERRGISDAVYDWRNLPESFSLSGGGTLSFKYDANGKRIKKSLSGGATTYYIRGADGQTVAAYDGNRNLLYINILAGGKIIGRIIP